MSNYVQIEIGGELRGLKFNQGANVEIQLKIGKSKNAMFGCYAVVYGGLIGNCFVKGIEPDFTFEDVCGWVDEIQDESIFTSITDAYKASLPVVEETAKKKKLPQRNTKRNALK